MSFSLAADEFSSLGQILLLCILIGVFLSGKAVWEHSFSKLPPGPWGLPVIGRKHSPKLSFIVKKISPYYLSFTISLFTHHWKLNLILK